MFLSSLWLLIVLPDQGQFELTKFWLSRRYLAQTGVCVALWLRIQEVAMRAILAAILLGEAALAEPASEFGARPVWEEFRSDAEHAVRAKLIDPDSAKIQWPYNAIAGSLKPLFGKRVEGYYTCALVNSRNRMGGYSGDAFVLVMLKDRQPVTVEIGENGQIDAASVLCGKDVKEGRLPPAPAVVATQPLMAPSGPRFGFDFSSVPDGMYVRAVAAGSAAAAAHLVPGMVITHLNGVPLAGLDNAAASKIFSAFKGEATFKIVGVGDVKMVKPAL
jgi:hypothetical protein